MPESVTDRPTKAHEYIFLLTKSSRYYYDGDAIRESASNAGALISLGDKSFSKRQVLGENVSPSGNGLSDTYTVPAHRNKRSVWEIATQPYPEAHFATFPEALVTPCILAGTSEKGVCAQCGKPWKRIVDKDRTFESGSGRSGISPHGKNGYGLQGGGETGDIRRGPVVTVSTLGWEPTCTCTASSASHDANTMTRYPHNSNANRLALLRQSARARGQEYQQKTETIGWQPTCIHNAEIVPATILDPFVGSGTTMAVAQKLGRRGVGVDLSLEYLELAQKRLREIPLPMPLWA